MSTTNSFSTSETVILEIKDLERAFSPIMSLHSILDKAGDSGIDLPADDIAYVLGSLLHDAYTRIGHPQMAGAIL